MLQSSGSIYPFSNASIRWSTLVARYDRSSFLFFLLSLPLPFVLRGDQRDILLLFCLLASASLRIPWAMKAIRGGRQVAVVAIFGRLRFQYAETLSQPRDLGSQGRILFSELVQFFVFGHTGTLLACSSLCKPLVLLASYVISLISWCVCSINLGDGSARLA